MEANLSSKEFKLLKEYIYDNTGINLPDHKVDLLKTRLTKRLRALNLKSFEEYYKYLVNNTDEYTDLVNAVSTNVTSFFREPRQWDFLKKEIQKIKTKNTGRLRIWSSASSSGEEAYTIGMFLKEELRDFDTLDIRILATDISHDILKKAMKGIYSGKAMDGLQRPYVLKYFTRIGKTDSYSINKEIKDLVLFREFNLVHGDYSIFGGEKFDIVFCRNVMIYFDMETKNKMITNILKTLKKGGYIFLGHSENLMNFKGLEYIIPTVYRKL